LAAIISLVGEAGTHFDTEGMISSVSAIQKKSSMLLTTVSVAPPPRRTASSSYCRRNLL